MTTATISLDHYLTLLEMSAESAGRTMAQQVVRTGRFIHPGDPMGSLLAHAWEVDRNLPVFGMKAFLRALRTSLDEGEVESPSVDEVLASLPLAINTARFNEVDVDVLIADLRRDLPTWFDITE
uniref:hypothetical protein n=1 Tax=Arthrobacter sp. TaxID=1667 RepID=UPI00159EBDA2|nr:hypothetical protein [Arthrobacter sp.]